MTADSVPDSPSPPSRKRLTPPMETWVIAIAFVITAVIVRRYTITGDHAVVNILTFACGVAVVLTFETWFVFFSAYSRKARLGVPLFLLGVLIALGVAFRVEEVSGELVPTFRPRWSKRYDETLATPKPPEAARTIDLTTTTADDFPQFLGPNRNGWVDSLSLATNWESQPPRLLWKQPIGAGWSAFAAVNGFAVTMEQRGPQELVTCYNVANGELIWSYATETRHETIPGGIGPRSTPTVDAGQVFAQGATGELVALDGSNGKRLWRVNLLERFGVPAGEDESGVAWGRSGSPLVVNDLVIIPAGGAKGDSKVSLAAFNRLSGELVWEAGDQQVSYSSPILIELAGRHQIVCVHEKSASGYDPESGKILWTFDWPANSTQDANVSQPLQIALDQLMFSKGYGRGAVLVRFTATSGEAFMLEEVWRDHAVLKTKFTSAVLHDGHVYGLSDGIMECVDAATGKRRWKSGRFGQGQILGVGDLILIQAESGEVVMIDASPKGLRERGRFQAIDGKTWNNLCLYGNRLLVRNSEQAACYELPK